EIDEPAGMDDAGVVDQHVERPVTLHPGDEPVHLARIGQVNGIGAAGQIGGQLLQRLPVAGGQRHAGPGGGAGPGDGRPDPPAGPGDQHPPPRQSHDPSSMTVTVPRSPSTSTSDPSGIRRVASVTETTQGIPSSREAMTAWLTTAPTSTTTAAAARNSGVHEGSVIGATRTSPAPRPRGSPGSVTTRARPRAVPPQPAIPCRRLPPASGSAERPRLAHVSTGGGSPSKRKGGTRLRSRS